MSIALRQGDLPAPPIFHAVLRPEGVMSGACFAILAAVIGAAAIAFAALLLANGFRLPVLFLAAEVAFLLTLLHVCRLRRLWSEEVRADRAGVTVLRFDHAGRKRDGVLFPLLSLTLERVDDPDFGLRQLRLLSRGRAVELARDLAPRERAAFARRLEAAMREARCPPCRRDVTLPGTKQAA
jgi:uncharacterized membrane protein